MAYKYLQPIFIIFDREKNIIGVISGFKAAMEYINENDSMGYTYKEFRVNELIS